MREDAERVYAPHQVRNQVHQHGELKADYVESLCTSDSRRRLQLSTVKQKKAHGQIYGILEVISLTVEQFKNWEASVLFRWESA
jgi:hypothetical protein